MFKVKYDKDKAIFLRKIGWEYSDIAEFLQCSESWCKLNLKGVEKDKELMHKAAVIARLYIQQVKEEV